MSRPYGFHELPYNVQMSIRQAEHDQAKTLGSAQYWRNAYETLVKQTGRDLNDGLGLDPRKRPQPSTKD